MKIGTEKTAINSRFSFSPSLIKKYAQLFSYFKVKNDPSGTKVFFKKDLQIPADGFRISFKIDKTTIYFSNQRGKLFALQELLKKISQNDFFVNDVEEHPQLSFRGFSLDISRGAIPHLKTLIQLAFHLFLNRYNHFALYIEDTLQNELLKKYFPNKEVLPLADLKKLQQFCQKYQLELFPEVQLLGHLEKVLCHPELRKYANKRDLTCLNVYDPTGCVLVNKFVGRNVSHFSSKLINIGFDELDNLSTDEVLKRLQEVIKLFKGKKIAIWADQLFKRPQLLNALPAGSLLFNWNYFALKSREFPIIDDQQGKYSQILCPAIRSWLKFIPDYQKSFQNITAAIQAANHYKLQGVMLTCWGDGGNETLLNEVFPLIDFCGKLSWNCKKIREKQSIILNKYPYIRAVWKLDHKLPFTHRYYFLEDPIRAPYSKKSGQKKVKANYLCFLKKLQAVPPSAESKLWKALINLILSKIELTIKINSCHPDKKRIAKASLRLKNDLLHFQKIFSVQWKKNYRPNGLKINQEKFQAILKRLQVVFKFLNNKNFFTKLNTELNSSNNAELKQSADWKEIFNN